MTKSPGIIKPTCWKSSALARIVMPVWYITTVYLLWGIFQTVADNLRSLSTLYKIHDDIISFIISLSKDESYWGIFENNQVGCSCCGTFCWSCHCVNCNTYSQTYWCFSIIAHLCTGEARMCPPRVSSSPALLCCEYMLQLACRGQRQLGLGQRGHG